MSIPYQLDKESKSVACEIKRKKKNKCLTKEWSVKVKYFKGSLKQSKLIEVEVVIIETKWLSS